MSRLPWIDFVRRRREAERSRITERDVREAIAQEDSMPEVTIKGAQCIRCGLPDAPTASAHGLRWTIEVCEPCTQRIAARWLLRTAPRLIRDKLEAP